MLCIDLMEKNQNQTKQNQIPNQEIFQLKLSTAEKCLLGQNVYFIPSIFVTTLKSERSEV